ncbi:hypothetical protein BDF21DRAFT_249976 [Thamnidium elegans]|nr:hypothetical protein BDF21DRAFT_249976 [Thamnidium elegans]
MLSLVLSLLPSQPLTVITLIKLIWKLLMISTLMKLKIVSNLYIYIDPGRNHATTSVQHTSDIRTLSTKEFYDMTSSKKRNKSQQALKN